MTGAIASTSDLPPEGHSRFDVLIGDGPIPFPLSALMARITDQLESSTDGFAPIKTTLIPLGRSLQRMAAAPDFFTFPRVVAAVDGTQREGFAPLRDRLFFGYNERAEVLEVISYNEAAGRFEFQVVRHYRAGATPQLYYASRALCTACHQNEAPIFSRPLWDETSANPAIAAKLATSQRDKYGVALTGTDVAYLIDIAVERAGLYPLWQRIWRDGCDAGCRMEWLDATLRYALAGVLTDPPAPLGAMAARWGAHWPQGLPVPSSSLPNRDPLQTKGEAVVADQRNAMLMAREAGRETASELHHLAPIPPLFEPLGPRPPKAYWRQPDSIALTTGLAGLLDTHAVAAFDRALASTDTPAAETRDVPCRITVKPARMLFTCATPDVALSGVVDAAGGGRSNALSIDGARTANAIQMATSRATKAGDLEFTPLREFGNGTIAARLSDGRRWTRLQLHTGVRQWPTPGATPTQHDGSARITLVDDYAPARAALAQLPIIADPVFDGTRALTELRTQLGHVSSMPAMPSRWPPARLEPTTTKALTGAAVQFQHYCGECHDNAGGFPPNFMAGDTPAVEARLSRCAQRIFYRLSQWRIDPAQRRETPMPPPSAVAAAGADAAAWTSSADLEGLLADAGRRLKLQGSDPDTVLAARFETLNRCPSTLDANADGAATVANTSQSTLPPH